MKKLRKPEKTQGGLKEECGRRAADKRASGVAVKHPS